MRRPTGTGGGTSTAVFFPLSAKKASAATTSVEIAMSGPRPGPRGAARAAGVAGAAAGTAERAADGVAPDASARLGSEAGAAAAEGAGAEPAWLALTSVSSGAEAPAGGDGEVPGVGRSPDETVGTSSLREGSAAFGAAVGGCVEPGRKRFLATLSERPTVPPSAGRPSTAASSSASSPAFE